MEEKVLFNDKRNEVGITDAMIAEDVRELERNPTLTEIRRNAVTGYPTKIEQMSTIGYGGLLRAQFPPCPKWVQARSNRCQPIPGTAVSRRCPNSNQACTQFFNYQKFLQCFNRFEHLGADEAESKCHFLKAAIHPVVKNFYEQLREDKDWIGIQSNYKPKSDDDEDDDDDDF